ncbi:hypothetical protein B1R94_07525 [Mycolicibacterium litorale]|nr:hypothetical protein B1R94_07525 [Mycolicibacterium litorale]
MKSTPRLRSVVIVCALATGVPLGLAGSASGDTVMDALVNTSCSYAQVTAALGAQAPALAAQLTYRPDMQAGLQQFLAMPADQRQQALAQQQAANPQLQAALAAQFGPQVVQVANTCMNY